MKTNSPVPDKYATPSSEPLSSYKARQSPKFTTPIWAVPDSNPTQEALKAKCMELAKNWTENDQVCHALASEIFKLVESHAYDIANKVIGIDEQELSQDGVKQRQGSMARNSLRRKQRERLERLLHPMPSWEQS